jgi:hypothetical protein
MLKVSRIYFGRLTNEQHYGYFLGVQRLFEAFPDVSALVAHILLAFGAKLELGKKLLDIARASYLTSQLLEADSRVDRDIISIRKAIKVALRHFDSAIAEAAQQLNLRLKDFGNIVNKPYEAQTAAVQVLLHELTTTFAAQVALVGLTPWVRDLMEAEEAFLKLYAQRVVESTERPKERFVDVRRGLQGDFGQIVTSVESDIIANGEAKCGEFVRLLNELTKSFSEHSRRQQAKHDLQQATVDSIPDQPFVGKAVTPLPIVRYTTSKGDTLELAFAKDFSVAYKNNECKGNASLSIRGKGKYGGSKVVTFRIV